MTNIQGGEVQYCVYLNVTPSKWTSPMRGQNAAFINRSTTLEEGKKTTSNILRHDSYYSKVYPTRYGLLVSQTYWIVLPKGTINNIIIIIIICIYKHKILQLILIVRHISLFCVIFTNNTTEIKENLLFCLWKQINSVFDPYSMIYQLYWTFIEQCSSFRSFSLFTFFKYNITLFNIVTQIVSMLWITDWVILQTYRSGSFSLCLLYLYKEQRCCPSSLIPMHRSESLLF